jgi:2',3'-cyclic-nucleotide 2'-phosphodiesterase (5'-nucleotidase family)
VTHRSAAPLVTGIALALALAAPAHTGTSTLQPDKLIILSTTDMKGKTLPCGCHVPKGGIARQVGFADSVRQLYSNVVRVDGGGFFPEDDTRADVAWFMMDELKKMDATAVGVGERDLRYGLAALRVNAQRTAVPLVCSNLVLASTKKPIFATTIVKPVGAATVGFFGLISDKANLGPAHDSLAATDPVIAGRRAVADLKQKGATVIVFLSRLGKAETEDLVTTVDGIDVAIAGQSVPFLDQGRPFKRTTVVYGGEQGQYLGFTRVTLDAAKHADTIDAVTYMMGPAVRENAAVAARVAAFEDGLKQKQASAEKEKAAPPAEAPKEGAQAKSGGQ